MNKVHAVYLNMKGTALWQDPIYRQKVTRGAQAVSDSGRIIVGLYDHTGRTLLIIPPKSLPQNWFV
jgi:hypothetical protein